MNFFAMPTLKNERACLRLPISIRPRFSSKVMLARLRTGIDKVGSWLRCAAPITTSATPISFFSTAPFLFVFFLAIFFSCSLPPADSFIVFFSEWKNGLLFTPVGLGVAFLLGPYWLSLDRFLGLFLGQSWQCELGLVRGRFFCGGDGSFIGQSRRIAFNTVRRDNDRIGKPFGAGLFPQ